MSYLLVQVKSRNTQGSHKTNSTRISVVAFSFSSTSYNESAIRFYMVDDASFKGYDVTEKESQIIRKSMSQQFQNNPLNRNRSVAGDYEFFGTLSLAPSAANFKNLGTYTVNVTNVKAGSDLFRF